MPETLTPEEFWTRYFFRVYQVEREEAHRRAIIQGIALSNSRCDGTSLTLFVGTAAVNDDDFSWEDDDDDPTSPTTKVAPAPASTEIPSSQQEASPGHLSAPPAGTKSRTSTPGNLSPRQSSEDSYDVVSSQVSSNGAAETATLKAKKTDEGTEDDEDDEDDEDNEDDEDDEDEEEGEDGEEDDSDWE